MPSIKELIQAELDLGKTVRELEADSGYRVRFQTFQELSKHPPKQFPKQADTVVGMAAALNVPEVTIVLAYATSLGIPINTNSPFTLRIPPGADGIDPPLQDAIIQLMRAALKSGSRRRVVVNAVTDDESEELAHPLATFVRESTGEFPGEDRQHYGQ
jgi:hypothetical protein